VATGIEKQGLAMRLGKESGSVAALLKDQIHFWSRHPQEGIPRLRGDKL
jgi:hypothetical protein